MKSFNKKFTFSFFTTLLLFLIFSPQIILAACQGATCVTEGLDVSAKAGTLSTGAPASDIAVMMGRSVNYIFGIVGVIFLTIVLVGGYLWMTAGGNEEKVKKAKEFIVNGINGMIVIFIAYAVVYTILGALSASIKP